MLKKTSILSAFLILAVLPDVAQSQTVAPKKLNILWIVAEDLNPAFGCYGDPVNKGKTPVLDKMAAQGVLFSRCYVPAPVCSPCRSAILTGAMQTTLGIHNHRSSRSKVAPIHLPEGVTTLPELFRALGYFTFNVGKDDYNFEYDRSKLYAKAKLPYPWRGRKQGQPFFGQIQLRGGKWFFALLKNAAKKLANPTNPEDVEVPPYFPDIETMRKHFALHKDTARITDAEIGAILAHLAEDGLLENTIVFFFSDHGMPNSVRHKQFCYEGGVRVPLVIAGPGIPKGAIRNDLISGLDITATTVALAGMKQPSWYEGQDLFGKEREFVISARDRCDYTIDRIRTVRTDRFRYIRNFMTDRPWLQPQYRDGRDFLEVPRQMFKEGKLNEIQAKYFADERPAEELYDLKNDPHQIKNLANDPAYTKELKRHREILQHWIKKTDDKGRYPESEEGLLEVLIQWKDKCVNPEYEPVRAKYKDRLQKLNDNAKKKKNNQKQGKKKVSTTDQQSLSRSQSPMLEAMVLLYQPRFLMVFEPSSMSL